MSKILDKNMAVLQADTDGIAFYDPDSEHFQLGGFAWRKKGMPFDRYSGYGDTSMFNDKLRGLARFSAGGTLRFVSDTRRIVIRASFKSVHRIVRMALTGIMGFDVYVRHEGKMLFRGVTAFNMDVSSYCVNLFSDSEHKTREFLIHLPLYAELDSLEIGVEEGSAFSAPPSWADLRPLVCYGTSILQGACANRPGMAYPAILSRMLERPVYNFGFAGAAKGEGYMAKMLADVENPCCCLLDYDPNSSWENTKATLPSLISTLRAKHPQTPILFVSKIPYPCDTPGVAGESHIGAVERARLEEGLLQSLGTEQTYFISGTSLLDNDFAETSVDACHISDYGFIQMAKKIAPLLDKIIV